MHSLLERYLSEVAAHLSALPVKPRREELREMRTHLENAALVSREQGQTEDEAAQNIAAQFGTPQDLGENVVWAWRRGKIHDIKKFLGAAFTTFILLNTLPYLMTVPYNICAFLPNSEVGFWALMTPAWLLIGVGIGTGSARLFPQRAVTGTALVMGGWVALRTIRFFLLNLGPDRPFAPISQMWIWDTFLNSGDTTLMLVAVAAAWVSSRRRMSPRRRSRLARG